MSSSHPGCAGGGGGGTTFSSSSLNALQAISEGVGNPMPSPLSSPAPHKPESSPSVHSTNQGLAQGGPSKAGHPAPSGSKSPGGEQHPHTPVSEGPPEKPDSQAGREAGSEPGGRRLPDTKGHKKLLQLLISPTDELVPGNPTANSGPGSAPDHKDGVTSPTTGVSSSTGAAGPPGLGAVTSSGAAAHFGNQSLQEKHKILHKLLQNGNTPDEVARITAEATGKSSLEGGAAEGPAAGGGHRGPEPKQEQHSPKKEKTHALLHYLLNKDDSKDGGAGGGGGDTKPKAEELEGRGPQGGGVSSSNPQAPDGKVKTEPLDEVHTLWSIGPISSCCLQDARGVDSGRMAVGTCFAELPPVSYLPVGDAGDHPGTHQERLGLLPGARLQGRQRDGQQAGQPARQSPW